MNHIDKIVLSSCKKFCAVHIVNGPTLHFNFFQMRMSYIEGLKWLEGMFRGPVEEKQAA